MRAFITPQYGPAETQRVAEVPKPSPNENEILVRVMATTVNRSDTEMRKSTYWFARGFFGLTKPKCEITGSEFAGVVAEVGAKVKRYKVGDRVFGFDGDDYRAHAEHVVKREDKPIALMPEGYSFEECVVLGEGPSYAMNYVRNLGVGSDTLMAINGATGAIGSAAVQLASHLGARIVATARAEHFDLVKDWGAEEVIDYTKEDFTERDFQFDVVFDAVGKSTFGKTKRVLKPNGLYGSSELGPRAENVWKTLLGKIVGGKRPIFPIPKISAELLASFAKLMQEGKLTPHTDRTYSFNQIMEATKYVEQGQKVGSVVVTGVQVSSKA